MYDFQIFIHMSMNIIIKNHDVLIVKHVNFWVKNKVYLYISKNLNALKKLVDFCYFTQPFSHTKF